MRRQKAVHLAFTIGKAREHLDYPSQGKTLSNA